MDITLETRFNPHFQCQYATSLVSAFSASGHDPEWYTPQEYIKAAKEVMGGIDLDPASCAVANEVVRAERFYTAEDDGLSFPWEGRVWLNPPYGATLITKFVEKLLNSPRVEQAIVLVNNASETKWSQQLALGAQASCNVKGRIKFWHPEKDSTSPMQGQTFFYFGENVELFCQVFSQFGSCALLNTTAVPDRTATTTTTPPLPPDTTPLDAVFTDTGNAVKLVAQHGENIRYVAEDKQWLRWDGSRWEPDALGRVMELAKETVLSMYLEASTVKDDALRVRISKWASTSLSDSKLTAMVKLARTDPKVALSAASLDANVWLLNCTNGTVDLRTGELHPAERSDLITKTTGIAYNPDAKCPRWDAFILWAMKDRQDLVTYMYRALGMSLSGNVSARLVFFCHGGGDNGKSVTLKTVLHISGDYGQRMQSSTLEAATKSKGGGGASDDIASLKGARFVCTSEIEDGTRLASALLKDLTGDEKLTARHLYKSQFTFQPELHPWIAANHKPLVPSDDQAVWNRLRLIPFDAVVSEADMDPELGDKLKDEAPGILATLVRGCLDWQRDGLPTPAAVLEASASYREEQDTFKDFLDYLADGSFSMTPSMLRETYSRWAKENDAPKLSQRAFKSHMEARGWFQEKLSDGTARQWKPPAKKVIRVDYAAMARAAATYEPTQADLDALGAELDAIEWFELPGPAKLS